MDKKKIDRHRHKKVWLQWFAALVALAVIATGIRPILKGDLFYNNWWGGLVFGPMTVVGGLLFLYVVIFRWDKVKRMK